MPSLTQPIAEASATATIVTKTLVSTPEETHIKCTVPSGRKLSLSAWGYSFAQSVQEESGASKIVLHFYQESKVVHSTLYPESATETWGSAFRQLHSTRQQQTETFLFSKPYTFEKEERPTPLSDGFTHDHHLVSGTAFVLVRIAQLPLKIVDILRNRYFTGYNTHHLVIHLNFPEFSDIRDLLSTFQLEEGVHFACIDFSASAEAAYDVYPVNDWATVVKDLNSRTVRIIQG